MTALQRTPGRPTEEIIPVMRRCMTVGETSALDNAHDSQNTVSKWDFASDSIAKTEPPTDGGRDAWLVLASSFVLGALVWGEYKFLNLSFHLIISTGFPYTFGVFQEYYLRHESFSASPSGVAAIGTTTTVRGMIYGILSC